MQRQGGEKAQDRDLGARAGVQLLKPDVCLQALAGFAPGDVVTAILNVNAGTAQFCKRTRVRGRTPEDDKEFETQLVTIHGVECTEAGLRFGVQMDRDGPGVSRSPSAAILVEFALLCCAVNRWRLLLSAAAAIHP
jgi:hypothetical protein